MAEKIVNSDLAATLGESTTTPQLRTQTIEGQAIYLLSDVLSRQQCCDMITATEAIGYGTTWYAAQYRGNLRLMCDDPSLACSLWKQLEPHLRLQVHFQGRRWMAVGLNPRFRFAKYPVGTAFAEHVDTFYTASDTHRSFYTVNVYLNDAHPTSGTRFNAGLEVKPVAGMALVFPQPPVAHLLHEGLKVVQCEKYLMRTDVMFEPK